VGVGRLPTRRPLARGHLSGLVELHAEYLLGGLVVEEQRARHVDQEDGHDEAARELPHQDELDRLLGHGWTPPVDVARTAGCPRSSMRRGKLPMFSWAGVCGRSRSRVWHS